MLMTIVTSHDWNVLVVRGFLQAKIHGQDLVSLQASNSSLNQRPNRKLFQRSRNYLLNFSTNSSKVTSS